MFSLYNCWFIHLYVVPAPPSSSPSISAPPTTSAGGTRSARFSENLGNDSTTATPSGNTTASIVPSARTDEDALTLYLELYLARSMESTRVALLARVVAYTTEQCQWIRSQKADAKNPEVLPPVAAFPTFVAQTLELCNGKVLFTI